ncbi:MAG: helix-turn-helix domain-containing protein [Aigarchaeota archaeon]|nr:helix-turn-helix domain-containing protein [Candidatus Pelearchaeum maunauluense]
MLKCIKCDIDEFAAILKIKPTDKKLDLEDLKKSTAIKVVVLMHNMHGIFTVFIRGRFNIPKGIKSPDVINYETPVFLDCMKQRITLVGDDSDIRYALKLMHENKIGHRILKLTSLKPEEPDPLANLTQRQKEALITAYLHGYYKNPKRTTTKDIAKLLGINKSTLTEHLIKAERKIITQTIKQNHK